MDGIAQQWMQSLPPVTRIYFVASGVLSMVEYLGYMKIEDILIVSNTVWNKDTLWRVPLNVVYNGKLSLDFATKLYFFSRYAVWLETSVSSSKNFLWMIFILVLMINTYSIFVTNLALIGPILKDVMLYIWTKKNTDIEVMFLFFTVKGDWIPWVSIICDLVIMGYFDPKILPVKLAGIFIGHAYWFVDSQIPILHQCKSPFTPIWEWKIFNTPQVQKEHERQEEQTAPLLIQDQQVNEIPQVEEREAQQEEETVQQDNRLITDGLDEPEEHELTEFMCQGDYQRETTGTLHNRNNL